LSPQCQVKFSKKPVDSFLSGVLALVVFLLKVSPVLFNTTEKARSRFRDLYDKTLNRLQSSNETEIMPGRLSSL
jgi:hypothetical protein